jgi:hypothetical protein
MAKKTSALIEAKGYKKESRASHRSTKARRKVVGMTISEAVASVKAKYRLS